MKTGHLDVLSVPLEQALAPSQDPSARPCGSPAQICVFLPLLRRIQRVDGHEVHVATETPTGRETVHGHASVALGGYRVERAPDGVVGNVREASRPGGLGLRSVGQVLRPRRARVYRTRAVQSRRRRRLPPDNATTASARNAIEISRLRDTTDLLQAVSDEVRLSARRTAYLSTLHVRDQAARLFI